jgi:hypothetical protein
MSTQGLMLLYLTFSIMLCSDEMNVLNDELKLTHTHIYIYIYIKQSNIGKNDIVRKQ